MHETKAKPLLWRRKRKLASVRERLWSRQTREKRQAACGHPQTPKDGMRAHIQRKTQEPHKPMPEEEQSPRLHRLIPQLSLSCLHCPRWEKLTMH